MKRWVWRGLVFLLIGAVINIAVAWGIGMMTSGGDPAPTPHISNPIWPALPPPGWSAADDAQMWHAFGYRVVVASNHLARLVETKYADPNVHVAWMVEYEYGWPMRSMRSVLTNVQTGTSHEFANQGVWREGIMVPLSLNPSQRGPRRFALNPMAIGFIVNSVFYGAITALVIRGASLARASYRVGRGRCPHCNYPTGTSPVCTECGKPVKPRAGAPA